VPPATLGSLPSPRQIDRSGASPPGGELIGRETVLKQLEELLLPKATLLSTRAVRARLITLTGPPGIGKTHVAVASLTQFAEAFEGRCFFVPLAALSDATLLSAEIARKIALPLTAQADALTRLQEFLGREPSLLVLDNLEQLLQKEHRSPVREILEALLKACPRLVCLVTSRQGLQIPMEYVITLSPLDVPELSSSVKKLLESPSVKVYLAAAHRKGLRLEITAENAEAVAALCRALQGVPLNLHLAAAQGALFPLEKRRIARELYTETANSVASSYALLSEPQKTLFTALAVFQGGWTLSDAQQVCEFMDASALETLCRMSLVQPHASGSHFSTLEYLREYAHEQQGVPEREAGQQRHAEHFLRLAEEATVHLERKKHRRYLRRLTEEHENLRTAVTFWLSAHLQKALRLAGALSRYWEVQGNWTEWSQTLEAAWNAVDTHADVWAVRVGRERGLVAFRRGEVALAHDHSLTALALSRTLGIPLETATLLNGLAMIARNRKDPETATAYAEEALDLFQQLHEDAGRGDVLLTQGTLALNQHDLAQTQSAALNAAQRLYLDSLKCFRAVGNQRAETKVLINLAIVASYRKAFEQAAARYDEAYHLSTELEDDFNAAQCLYN